MISLMVKAEVLEMGNSSMIHLLYFDSNLNRAQIDKSLMVRSLMIHTDQTGEILVIVVGGEMYNPKGKHLPEMYNPKGKHLPQLEGLLRPKRAGMFLLGPRLKTQIGIEFLSSNKQRIMCVLSTEGLTGRILSQSAFHIPNIGIAYYA